MAQLDAVATRVEHDLEQPQRRLDGAREQFACRLEHRTVAQRGDAVAADEPLVELETDKVTLEVNAPEAGTLSEIKAEEGATVEVGALLGIVSAGGGAATSEAAGEPKPDSEDEVEGEHWTWDENVGDREHGVIEGESFEWDEEDDEDDADAEE